MKKRVVVTVVTALASVPGLALAAGESPQETALLTVLGLNALATLFQAVFGGNGNRGLQERVGIVETKIDHVAGSVDQLQRYFGCTPREKN